LPIVTRQSPITILAKTRAENVSGAGGKSGEREPEPDRGAAIERAEIGHALSLTLTAAKIEEKKLIS